MKKFGAQTVQAKQDTPSLSILILVFWFWVCSSNPQLPALDLYIPAIDDSSTSAQIFIGAETLVTDIHRMKHNKEFINDLEDNIRKRGARDKLISDRAIVEISKQVQDILRALFIDNW